MDLDAIIDDIADRADDFLEGFSNRKDAQAGVREMITVEYPTLAPADREKVADGVMRILEKEGFFERTSANGAWGDNQDEGEEE